MRTIYKYLTTDPGCEGGHKSEGYIIRVVHGVTSAKMTTYVQHTPTRIDTTVADWHVPCPIHAKILKEDLSSAINITNDAVAWGMLNLRLTATNKPI